MDSVDDEDLGGCFPPNNSPQTSQQTTRLRRDQQLRQLQRHNEEMERELRRVREEESKMELEMKKVEEQEREMAVLKKRKREREQLESIRELDKHVRLKERERDERKECFTFISKMILLRREQRRKSVREALKVREEKVDREVESFKELKPLEERQKREERRNEMEKEKLGVMQEPQRLVRKKLFGEKPLAIMARIRETGQKHVENIMKREKECNEKIFVEGKCLFRLTKEGQQRSLRAKEFLKDGNAEKKQLQEPEKLRKPSWPFVPSIPHLLISSKPLNPRAGPADSLREVSAPPVPPNTACNTENMMEDESFRSSKRPGLKLQTCAQSKSEEKMDGPLIITVKPLNPRPGLVKYPEEVSPAPAPLTTTFKTEVKVKNKSCGSVKDPGLHLQAYAKPNLEELTPKPDGPLLMTVKPLNLRPKYPRWVNPALAAPNTTSNTEDKMVNKSFSIKESGLQLQASAAPKPEERMGKPDVPFLISAKPLNPGLVENPKEVNPAPAHLTTTSRTEDKSCGSIKDPGLHFQAFTGPKSEELTPKPDGPFLMSVKHLNLRRKYPTWVNPAPAPPTTTSKPEDKMEDESCGSVVVPGLQPQAFVGPKSEKLSVKPDGPLLITVQPLNPRPGRVENPQEASPAPAPSNTIIETGDKMEDGSCCSTKIPGLQIQAYVENKPEERFGKANGPLLITVKPLNPLPGFVENPKEVNPAPAPPNTPIKMEEKIEDESCGSITVPGLQLRAFWGQKPVERFAGGPLLISVKPLNPRPGHVENPKEVNPAPAPVPPNTPESGDNIDNESLGLQLQAFEGHKSEKCTAKPDGPLLISVKPLRPRPRFVESNRDVGPAPVPPNSAMVMEDKMEEVSCGSIKKTGLQLEPFVRPKAVKLTARPAEPLFISVKPLTLHPRYPSEVSPAPAPLTTTSKTEDKMENESCGSFKNPDLQPQALKPEDQTSEQDHRIHKQKTSSMKSALCPAQRDDVVRCRLVQDKSSRIGTTYYMFQQKEDGKEELMFSARAKKNTLAAHYVISLDPADLHPKEDKDVVKLRSNLLGNNFSLFDEHKNLNQNQKNSAPLVNNNKAGQELASICYGTDVWARKASRRMSVSIPGLNQNFTDVPPQFADDHIELQAKEVMWYKTGFSGRVKETSRKNFQLIHADNPDYIVLNFSRVSINTFNLEYRFPMSPLQAFSIALSSIHSKLACR